MWDRLFAQDALLFTVPALLGTAVFLLKMGLMTLGAAGGGDADVVTDVDADLDVDLGEEVEGGDSTEAFKLLSVQAIAAFLLGFGWGGLGALVGFDWSLPTSLAVGAAFGAGMVWLIGLMMRAVYELQSSGTVRIAAAIGRPGTVYVGVPAKGAGRGQVRVVIGDRARIYGAISTGEALPRGTAVRVVSVADRTLTVTAAS